MISSVAYAYTFKIKKLIIYFWFNMFWPLKFKYSKVLERFFGMKPNCDLYRRTREGKAKRRKCLERLNAYEE